MKRLIIVFSLCLTLNESFSQKKLYKYEVEKKIFTIDSLYSCIESEFQFERNQYSNKEFCDYSFYINGQDTLEKKSDYFKIINNVWYKKINKNWVYFFSKENFDKGKITPSCYLLKSSSHLYPYKCFKKENGKMAFIFKLKNSANQIDNLFWIFDPSIGFISIDIDNCQLTLK